jgi:hypothetical protein
LKPFKKVKQRLAEGGRKQGGSGNENDQEGREADVEGRRASQQSSRKHSEGGDVRIGVGHVDQQKVNPLNPSPALFAPSISHGAESGGTTLSTPSQPLPVTVSSPDTDNPPILDRVQEPARLPTHLLDSGAPSEDTLNRKSTASATPNLILRGVEESSGAYPPLKSVARCLCLVLDNCEVQSPSHTFNLQSLQLY